MIETGAWKKMRGYLKKIQNLWFLKPLDAGHSGVPDVLMCWKGRFIVAELKNGQDRKETNILSHPFSRLQLFQLKCPRGPE